MDAVVLQADGPVEFQAGGRAAEWARGGEGDGGPGTLADAVPKGEAGEGGLAAQGEAPHGHAGRHAAGVWLSAGDMGVTISLHEGALLIVLFVAVC